MKDIVSQFTNRKKEHIFLSLKKENSAQGAGGFNRIQLVHSALPEMDFKEVDISTHFLNKKLATPFMVTGMTGGWDGSVNINHRIARVCNERAWIMGVGSQRRQIFDSSSKQEMIKLRKAFPHLVLAGNIGLSQLIRTPLSVIEELICSLKANMMVVHTNPLQEALQPEGTPKFAGGIKALKKLCKQSTVPVILKETGCGFSQKNLQDLIGVGLFAVDLSGYGGTHWGRIEAGRTKTNHPFYGMGEAFKNWGISTIDALLAGRKLADRDYELWASGGIRNGCDGAKALALGAKRVGIAQVAIQAALKSSKELEQTLARLEQELKIALFCTASRNIKELQSTKNQKWKIIYEQQ